MVTPLMSPFVLSLSEAFWCTKDTSTRFLLSLPKDSVQTVRCNFCVLRMIDRWHSMDEVHVKKQGSCAFNLKIREQIYVGLKIFGTS